MAGNTNIEWTDASWNPIVGCTIVSPGCTNCYAMKMASRLQKMNRTGGSNSNYVNHYDGTTQPSKAGAVWTGKVAMAPDKIFEAPLGWRTPRRVFVNSMGDLFHEAIEDYQIAMAFGVMTCATQHTYQVLTKRSARMCDLLSSSAFWDEVNAFSEDYAMERSDALNRRTDDYRATSDDHDPENPPSNIWLGVSCERQQEADERIPHLMATPAAVRFISAEPLLGPLTISYLEWARLDWVIVGGESGPRARPMNPQWARDIRDQCKAAGIAFFHKQNGEYASVSEVAGEGTHFHFPDGRTVRRVGKKRAGRLLDGKEHNEFPVTDSSASQSGLSPHESKQNPQAAQS